MCAINSRVQELGARIVVVGNGKPWQAAAFRDEAKVPFVLYTDPGLHSYQVAGLRRRFFRALHPRVFFAALRARRDHHRQTGLQGDPWQLGGVFLFDAAGRLRWRHVSAFPGDHAPADAIVSRLRDLTQNSL